MSDEAAFSENVKSTMEKGFFNHSFMPMAAEGPIYCVWEAKEGISDSEFQDFIDGPDGVNWGLVALNNNVMKLDLALTGGQTPYESKFQNLIIKNEGGASIKSPRCHLGDFQF